MNVSIQKRETKEPKGRRGEQKLEIHTDQNSLVKLYQKKQEGEGSERSMEPECIEIWENESME